MPPQADDATRNRELAAAASLPGAFGSERRWFMVGYALLAPLYLVPLCVTHFLPGLDLPFHLAIVDLLRKLHDPQGPYHALYRGGLTLAPYSAHYAVLLGLSYLCPLNLANKLLLGAYVAGLPLALGRLLSGLGRWQPLALLAFPLAYNMPLHYGFISFALSIPILLLVLAELVRPPPATGPAAWLGFGRFAALAMLLFLTHLQNYLFGLCACVALTLAIRPRRSWRLMLATGLLPSVGALVHWQLVTRSSADADASLSSLSFALRALWRARLADLAGKLPLIEDLWMRLVGLRVHMLRGFTDGRDRLGVDVFLLVLALYIGVALYARRLPSRQPAPVGTTLGSWLVILGALVGYLALPHHLPELQLMTFHPRFAVLLAVLLPLGVPASLGRIRGRALPALLAPAVLFAGWYGVELIREYHAYGRELADFGQVLDETPSGGRALGLVYDRNSRVMNVESALVALPSYYPIERRSPHSSIPIFYCGMRHMPCQPQAPSTAPNPWAPRQLDPLRAIGSFDLFFVRGGPRPVEIFGKQLSAVEAIAAAGRWTVYRRKGWRAGPD
jgi:hypothetical protein